MYELETTYIERYGVTNTTHPYIQEFVFHEAGRCVLFSMLMAGSQGHGRRTGVVISGRL